MGLGCDLGDQFLFYPCGEERIHLSGKRDHQLKHLRCLMHRALVLIFKSLEMKFQITMNSKRQGYKMLNEEENRTVETAPISDPDIGINS